MHATVKCVTHAHVKQRFTFGNIVHMTPVVITDAGAPLVADVVMSVIAAPIVIARHVVIRAQKLHVRAM